jgi:GT2 family glycosyltransferase
MPGALRYIGETFARRPDIDVVYGHRVLIDENGREIGRWVLPPHENQPLRFADYVPQETLFWRRAIYERVGGVNPDFHFALDWDLLLRFQKAGARIVRLPYFLGCFRVHAAQKTSAQINSRGLQEMDQLRLREHGRELSRDEIDHVARRLQMKGAATARLLAMGIRV